MPDNIDETFSQLHIDIARNSTDDFNLFHDPHKWHRINGNPFAGPIVLGFQLESLIERHIKFFRREQREDQLITAHAMDFSNYQFSFANAVKPGQHIEIDIKPSQFKLEPAPLLSNRVTLKANGKLALIGYKKESTAPLFLNDIDFATIDRIREHPDRSYLIDTRFFLKRKFMTNSNAKNFLCASLCDQSEYFDELADKVVFPEIFPCSLISCALLEKAVKNRHDFERNPMVYTSHKISIDTKLLAALRSNDALHILIKPTDESTQHDFGDSVSAALDYECYGLVSERDILFRASISLAPLELIVKALA